MKKFNFKLLMTWFLTAVGITQICAVGLLMFTGDLNYLYGAIVSMLLLVGVIILFGKFMD
jgi:hypothetical protein